MKMSAWWQRLFLRPPFYVTLAARRAFRERRIPPAPCVDIVFDSSLSMPEPMRPAHRVLMLHGEGFDIVLTVTRDARQCQLGGTVITRARPLVLSLRRPFQPLISLPCTSDGHVGPTIVPAGTASLVAHGSGDDYTWQSDWLTI